MPSRSLSKNPSRAVGGAPASTAPDLNALLGRPPLLEGEDASAYEALAQEIQDYVQAKDAIDLISARDLTNLTWEIERLRRARDHVMRSSAHKGLRILLQPLVGLMEIDELCVDWAKRDPAAVKEVSRLLAKAGIDPDAIGAQTLRVELPTIESIDTLIARAEARRHVTLREMDRRRELADRRSNGASEAISNAPIKQLEGPRRG